MNVSELAESLERAYEKIGSDGWQSIYDDVMSDFPIIIKSLRFAADMEKMKNRHPRIEPNNGCVLITIYDDIGNRIRFDAPDIYTAARKAVEALEGKQ